MEIIEGRNPVIEALKAGRPISKILLDKNVKSMGPIIHILEIAKLRNIQVDFVDKQFIEKQYAGGVNQGVIAFASAKEYVDLDDLLDISRKKRGTCIILDTGWY